MSAGLAPRPVTPVSILADRLADVSRRLERDADADPDLVAELRAAHALAAGLDPYLSRCTTPPSPALANLAEHTAAEDWGRHSDGGGPALEQEMLSGHVEGQLLKFLVHMTGARRVLELGMFTGYSALAMAEALPEDGELVACEVDLGVAEFAQRHFDGTPAGDRITVSIGPALATLDRLAGERATFGLVFIDADKAGYAAYVERILDAELLAPGGVICVDNTLMQGEPYRPGGPRTDNGTAIAAFNAAVAGDERVEQVLLPLRDGLTLIRRADGR